MKEVWQKYIRTVSVYIKPRKCNLIHHDKKHWWLPGVVVGWGSMWGRINKWHKERFWALVLHGSFVLQAKEGGSGCLPDGLSTGCQAASCRSPCAIGKSSVAALYCCCWPSSWVILGTGSRKRLTRGASVWLSQRLSDLVEGCGDYTRLLCPVRSANP